MLLFGFLILIRNETSARRSVGGSVATKRPIVCLNFSNLYYPSIFLTFPTLIKTVVGAEKGLLAGVTG
jgi:hypothetical protein